MHDDIYPLFFSLMHRYKALSDDGQSHTEEAAELFNQAYSVAPEDFKKKLQDAAVKLGLMPATPDGYSDAGEPLYFMGKHCERLGIDPADVPEHLTRHAHTGPVHRVN